MEMDDMSMQITPTQQLQCNRSGWALSEYVTSQRIGLKAVQRAMQLRQIASIEGQQMLRVPINTLKEHWLGLLRGNGLGIFDAMVLLASDNSELRSVDEIMDMPIDGVEVLLRNSGLFSRWDRHYTPLTAAGDVAGLKQCKLAVEGLFGPEKLSDVRVALASVSAAAKRERGLKQKGARDREVDSIVPPESPSYVVQRQEVVQQDQDQAIRDLLLGLSKEMKRTTQAVESSVQELANTNSTVQMLSHRVTAVEVAQKELHQRVEEQEQAVQQAKSLAVAAQETSEAWGLQASQMQKDGKCLLLAGPGALQLLEQQGESGIRQLLIKWDQAYVQQLGGLDLVPYLNQAIARKAPFDSVDPRVLIQVWDKAVRDELCKRIKLSPARPREGMYAIACLTQHQRQMKAHIKSTIAHRSNLKMSLAADTVELWMQERQGAYRIALDLPKTKIDGLLEHAILKLTERPVVPPMQHGQGLKYINAVSWNVGGWSGFKQTILEKHLPGSILQMDVIALQETHEGAKGAFEGFQEIEVLREAHQRGGGVYIAIHPKWEVVMMKSTQEFVSVLARQGQRWVVFASVYIPPRNSKYERDYCLVLAELTEEIHKLTLLGRGEVPVLIMGDFNAHTGELQGRGKTSEGSWERGRGQQLMQRYSRDKLVDRRGKQLIASINDNHCQLLNGQCLGDATGAYTYDNRGSKSVLDYIIISTNVGANMCVLQEPGVCADGHAMLVTQMETVVYGTPDQQAREWAQQIRERVGGCNSSRGYNKQFILCAEGLQQLRQAPLDMPELTRMVQELGCHPLPPMREGVSCNNSEDTGQSRADLLLGVFEHEFSVHVEQFLQQRELGGARGKRINPTQAARRQQAWFNNECWAKLQAVYTARNTIGGNSRAAKREFKRFVRQQKRQYGSVLEHMRISNPKQFWQFLKVKGPECPLSEEVLVNHFRALLAPQGSQVKVPQLRGTEQSCIPAFTEAEVSLVLRKLKNGKSKAGHWVSAELLKGYESDQLAPMIARLFNSFRIVGLPTAWNNLLLVPVHKKGELDNPSNYRGIALMPVLAKVFAQCVLGRLEHEADAKKLRADGQAGFRKGHRIEDNALILKTLVQLAVIQGRSIWTCFVDLEKAYDRIDRKHLWNILEQELGVGGDLVEQVKAMYSEVRATVLTSSGRARETIPIGEGVKQGCPASPLLFSLLMDRVEQFIIDEVEKEGGLAARKARADQLRIGVLHILTLLFADDLVLCSYTQRGLQIQVDALAKFVDQNKLTVNVNKTKIMVMGSRGAEGEIYYKGGLLERVSSFRYLGILFNTRADDQVMLRSVLQRSKQAWAKLCKVLNQQGCYQLGTKMLLVDTFVRSHLIYGAAVWGPNTCNRVSTNFGGDLGKLMAFYRSIQRTVLGLGRRVRNEIVAAVAARPPLQVFILKQITRYYRAVQQGGQEESRLMQRVLKELSHIQEGAQGCTALRGASLGEQWPTAAAIYQDYLQEVTGVLGGAVRNLHPSLIRTWMGITQLGLAGKRVPVHLPVPLAEFKALFPTCKILLGASDQESPPSMQLWAWPHWLLQGAKVTSLLVEELYEAAGWWEDCTESLMVTLPGDRWTARDRVLGALIAINGLGKSLWLASSYVLDLVVQVKLGVQHS